jgi:hypothetical protein
MIILYALCNAILDRRCICKNAGELKIPNTNIIEININRVRSLIDIGYILIVFIFDENTYPNILSIDKSLLEFAYVFSSFTSWLPNLVLTYRNSKYPEWL